MKSLDFTLGMRVIWNPVNKVIPPLSHNSSVLAFLNSGPLSDTNSLGNVLFAQNSSIFVIILSLFLSLFLYIIAFLLKTSIIPKRYLTPKAEAKSEFK